MAERRGGDGGERKERRLTVQDMFGVGQREVDGQDTLRRRELSAWKRGWEDFLRTTREAMRYRELSKTPYGLLPVLVFTVIGVFAVFDASIFSIAIPDIVSDIDADIVPIFAIISIVGFFLVFIALGLAWVADRTRRIPFVGIGSIVMGFASLFTSQVQRQETLGAGRAFDGVGENIVNVPFASLLADYYPVASRGKVFALRGVVARMVRAAAPVLVGYLATATALSWRFPYLITGPLLILSGIAALFLLKEPVRGYMERKALGLSEEEARNEEEPVSFGETWRTVWSIRTLRRLFIGQIPANMGDFIFAIFFQILLFQVYGLTIRERGILFSVTALVAVPFGFYAGGVVDVLLRRRPQRVLVFIGSLSVVASLFLLGIATSPPLWVLFIALAGFFSASALIGPARSVIFVTILPAHVRNTGVNVFLLAEVPATIFRTFVVGYFFTNWGVEGVLTAAAGLILISSLIDLSAAGFFERDMRSALASQAAASAWRHAKESGQAKMLVCRDIDVEYDGVQVLFGVDFDVEEGDLIALLGTNGAGKSTLLKAISGVHEASSGAVVFDGRDITHMPPHEIAARGVVLMPGGRGIFPDLTVTENLMLGNWLNEEEESKTRLAEIYEMFPVLRERGEERSQLLSGGEQQMLSLSMAFLNKPRVLMIDELSLGLSPAIVQQLIEIVRKINDLGTTVIVVEQSVNVALTVAERAIFMEKGEVRFVGKTEDLLTRPDILRAVYVKGSGALTSAPASGVKGERERRRHSIEQARNILEVKGVTKTFGGVTAVDDVSFDLREGEALGLIGPNGAGKTTVFDIVSGYQRPDAGSVVYDGADVTTMSPEARSKKGLVRRFQDARLFPSLSVYENILVALERRAQVQSVMIAALPAPQVRQDEGRLRRRADRLVELLELGAFRDKFVKELSTGLRRITDIACILATEPKLLLLDEPSTGIAQAESENLAPLLRRVRHETGCSMLVIEHDMSLISELSDELLAMDQGATVLRGTPDDVLDDDRVISAYLGTSEDVVQRSGLRGTKVKPKARAKRPTGKKKKGKR